MGTCSRLASRLILSSGCSSVGWHAAGCRGLQRESGPILAGFHHVYQPCVVETGGDWRYRMWFFGWAAAPRIRTTRAAMRFTWRGPTTCGSGRSMAATATGSAHPMSPPRGHPSSAPRTVVRRLAQRRPVRGAQGGPLLHGLQRDLGGYWGGRGLSVPHGLLCDGAVSDDGIHWTKSSAPLLIAAQDSFPPQPARGRIVTSIALLRHENGVWRLCSIICVRCFRE